MSDEFDGVELEILRNQLESVAEEMGEVLVRSAVSPNITERRDCSTALFDAEGRLVAQAEHIPVHLGAMPDAVAAVIDCNPTPGEVYALNDPFSGGTHLPDVTLASPIARDGEIVGYAASRAHHADVGGSTPGSMPADSTTIDEEGVRLPPTRIVADGEIDDDVLDSILASVRNAGERRLDLRAQLAANDRGRERVGDLLADHGDRLLAAVDAVLAYSRDRMESELAALPDGTYHARDALEGRDGDPIPIVVAVTIDGASLAVDFAGTADQDEGNLNAPLAVAKSAVYFVVRCITDPEIPPNDGCYAPISVTAPTGSLVDPEPPAAVVGGNVETSQRIADVTFAALAAAAPERVPAAGQGTMNNLVVGTDEFTYYETIGGGAGATPTADGESAIQVGMTNTENTPIEALEAAYPLRVTEYAIREDSGGDGRHRGGDGAIRALRLETDATVSLLTDRRHVGPPGRAGGEAGVPGRNVIGDETVPSKVTRDLTAGTNVRIETPGGGGYGQVEGNEEDERSE